MTATNRAAKIAKLQKVLNKHYKPVASPTDRTVLEHLLYACCLENSDHEQADEAFARLQESYFDWNEVRVTTVTELAECMTGFTDANDAATRLKRSLHSLFETHYSFDLDFLKKENLGKAIKTLEAYKGISQFVVSYVVQHGLGGHSIPIDQAALELALVIGLINEKEARKGEIPGLERAVPKTKGREFASLMHQLAVAYHRTPFSPQVRKTVLEIDSGAKDRFPKRGGTKKAEKPAAGVKKAKTAKAVAKKVPAKKTTEEPAAKKKTSEKKSTEKKTVKKKPVVKKAKVAAKKKSPTKSLARKKPR